MKSFEEFVNESVDFRLGGSADKGSVEITFRELERGDIFYVYIVPKRKMTIDEKEARKVKRVGRDLDHDDKLRLDYISIGKSDWYTLVPKEYENSSRYAQERIPNFLYVFSTIEIADEEVLDIAEDYYKVQ